MLHHYTFKHYLLNEDNLTQKTQIVFIFEHFVIIFQIRPSFFNQLGLKLIPKMGLHTTQPPGTFGPVLGHSGAGKIVRSSDIRQLLVNWKMIRGYFLR